MHRDQASTAASLPAAMNAIWMLSGRPVSRTLICLHLHIELHGDKGAAPDR
jgi:hypothetical protein